MTVTFAIANGHHGLSDLGLLTLVLVLRRGTIRQAYSMIHSRKVVHNDIQPRHVLLEPAASEHVAAAEGQRKRVRIIDFDRAKAEGRENEARGDDRGRVKIGTMIEWERRMLDLMLNRCAEA